MKADLVTEPADISRDASCDASTIRIAGLLLVAATPVMFALAGGLWTGIAVGEGGQLAALPSGAGEAVETTMRALGDSIVAVGIALAGIGMDACGLVLLVSGQAHAAARFRLKTAALVLVLGLMAGPILGLYGHPVPTTPAAVSAESHLASLHPTGESQ